MAAEGDFLICAYASSDRRVEMPDAIEIKCHVCPTVILISPRGREIQEKDGMRAVCLRCGVKAIRKDGLFPPKFVTDTEKVLYSYWKIVRRRMAQ